MAIAADILIRRARRRGHDQLCDIAVADGRIAAIDHALTGSAAVVLDAEGRLVTESFVNPHLHLCKVWTLPLMQEAALRDYHGATMGRAMNAIELASVIKDSYEAGWIADNARRAVAYAAYYGNLHIRAFADVDGKARLEGVKALLQVREEFRGVIDLQVVAFAQDGILRDTGTLELMREAMALGADIVGGIPWIEFTDADAAAHVRACFDLAVEFDRDVSMLLDDAGDASLRTLEAMALEAERRSLHGRALAHHCRAMALYPEPYFQRLAGLLRRAGIAVVSDPHTGPLHARVQALRDAGITVCLGQDDISDAYYPFGRNNMLEVAFLASHLLWMTARSDIESLFDMITAQPARAMRLPAHGLRVGADANLVVLDHDDVLEAVRFHDAPRHVISHGRIIDQDGMLRRARSPANTCTGASPFPTASPAPRR